MRGSIRSIGFIVLATIFLVNCGSDEEGGVQTVKNSHMYNIEVVHTRTTGQQLSEIFQILFAGEYATGNNITCSVISPHVNDPLVGGDFENCTVDFFDADINILTANFDLGGEPSVLVINLAGTGPYVATLDDNSNDFTGHAREVDTDTRIRTQRHHKGYNFTAFSVINPDPNYQKAELMGAAATPIILWDNSMGNDGSKLYQNSYNSFNQADTVDGNAQLSGAYVSNTSNNGLTTELFSNSSLQLMLSNHTDPTVSDLVLNINYDKTLDPASLFSNSNPPKRADISIDGVAMTNAIYNSPAEISSSNYTISWPDTTTDPQNVRWRLRLVSAGNTGTTNIRHSEVRSARKKAGEAGGPTLTSGVWSWTVPSDFNIPQFGQSKIYLRASNADRSLAAQSQPFFVIPPQPL